MTSSRATGAVGPNVKEAIGGWLRTRIGCEFRAVRLPESDAHSSTEYAPASGNVVVTTAPVASSQSPSPSKSHRNVVAPVDVEVNVTV